MEFIENIGNALISHQRDLVTRASERMRAVLQEHREESERLLKQRIYDVACHHLNLCSSLA